MSVTLLEGDLSPALARDLQAAGQVAVDTETSGLNWATERLHLCQLFSPGVGTILVRHVEEPPAVLQEVMANPKVLKVMHFAPFDLKFLEAKWGVRAASVACTKAASRLLDPDAPPIEHRLQALLQRHLGVNVGKGTVRTSDWGASELSDEQIAYAAGDVEHLIDLHGVLSNALEARGLADLYSRVCAYMPIAAHLAVAGIPDPLTY